MRATLMLILIMAAVAPLRAHESWISQGGHRNAAGESCCGESDCLVVDDKVRSAPGGFTLADSGEFVPASKVQPSQDAHYWRCHHLVNAIPVVRCFFAPMTTMLKRDPT